MAEIVMHGNWRIAVVHKDSFWPQRVVITGSANVVVPGVVGASGTIGGERWHLTVEHDPGGGWQPSGYVHADPLKEDGDHCTRLVVSKDYFWPGDRRPNDLVVWLEHLGGFFEVLGMPTLVGDVPGDAVRAAEARYLAVTVQNTGYKSFDYDTVLDVTDAGRDALARCGVVVDEDWRPEALRETGQEAYGRAVGLQPLEAGAHGVAYFPVSVDPTASGDAADVEFELIRAAGKDRRASRAHQRVRIADAPAESPRSSTPAGRLVSAREPADAVPVSVNVVGLHPRTRPPAGGPGASRTAGAEPGASRTAGAQPHSSSGPTAGRPY